MSNKYFGGVVTSTGVTGEVDADLKAVVTATRDRIGEKMAKLRVADAISEVFALFRRCNKYIDETTPWVLAKDEAQNDRLAEVPLQSDRVHHDRRKSSAPIPSGNRRKNRGAVIDIIA